MWPHRHLNSQASSNRLLLAFPILLFSLHLLTIGFSEAATARIELITVLVSDLAA